MSSIGETVVREPIRLRKRRPRSKIESDEERNKRKSEVLIAAQSLDNEIKNVKNLKRLSIGSLDLLIDPELEFRVNSNTNLPDINSIKRRSWASIPSSQVDISDSSISREYNTSCSTFEGDTDNDTDGITNSSIDMTRAEYLHDDSVFTSEPTKDRLGTISSNKNSIELSSPAAVLSRRNLTGIGSLRRGSHNVQQSQLQRSSSTHSRDDNILKEELDGDEDDEEAIKQNLLWVPANQHPNVKPENYLELVQDTLHNIYTDETNPDSEPEEYLSNKENVEVKRNRLSTGRRKYQGRNLQRRASSLRHSYTELNDSNEMEVPAENHHNNEQHARSVSLKDITEELTKISNNAGLTDSDAITLARSLSMAGSFAPENDEQAVENRKDSNASSVLADHDEEYASNMFMKNGLTIPQRSSLRRSKFNTYIIRSSTSSLPPQSKTVSFPSSPEDSNRLSIEEQTKDSSSSYNLPKSPSNYLSGLSPSSVITAESQGSIGDLYDHYSNSNKDSEAEEEFDHNDTTTTDASYTNSLESSSVSNDSVLYHPHLDSYNNTSETGSLLHESTEIHNSNAVDITDNDKRRNSKNETFPWMSENESINDNEVVNGDFIDNTHSQANSSNFKNRSNHSKNRHNPIMNVVNTSSSKTLKPTNIMKPINTKEINKYATRKNNETAEVEISSLGTTEPDISTKDQTSQTSSNSNEPSLSNASNITTQKKQTLEEKFVKLFKRKAHHRRSSSETLINTGKSSDTGVQEELKKRISKFRKNPKKQLNISKANKVQEKEGGKQQQQQSKVLDTKTHDNQKEIKGKGIKLDESNFQDERQSPDSEELPTLQPAVSVTSTKNKEHHSPGTTTATVLDNSNTNSVSSVFTETVHELDGDDSQDFSNNSDSLINTSGPQESSIQNEIEGQDESQDHGMQLLEGSQPLISALPPRKLTFADVNRSDKPNSPIQFSDSAFGFPLPALTNSTVIMFDHRLGINVERAIYRLSHLKLSDSKRELRQQVLLSNFMYSYLNLVNHTLYMEQAATNNASEYDTYNSDELETEGDGSDDYGNDYTSNDENGIGIQDNGTILDIDMDNNNVYEGSNQINRNSNVEFTTEQNNSNGTILIPEI